MAAHRSLLYFDGDGGTAPQLVLRFAEAEGLHPIALSSREELMARVGRSLPACVVLSASAEGAEALEICSQIKLDPFTAITPVAIMGLDGSSDLSSRGLQAGADEVLSTDAPDEERFLRLKLLLRRAVRDVSVHPTTRLPGTVQVERDVARRLEAGERFALCYADLDHFKEFNDRYGYNRGDRIIFLVSMILRDFVRGLAPDGFVGHIGGDDFLYTVPLEQMEGVCDEIIHLFDELIPYQYSEEDRRAGYFLGKDRRGNLHRIPLMTLSIGVVTNQFQEFTHTGQVSERAAEMKTYAKTLPGSVYVVDRRQIDMDPVESGEKSSMER